MACSASTKTSDGKACKKAIDELPETSWAINKDLDKSPWIQLNLGNFYMVETIKIKHRSSHEQTMFKDISLEFSGAIKHDYMLNHYLDWNDVVLSSPYISDFIKITGKGVYGDKMYDSGFSDVQVFGGIKGTPYVKIMAAFKI